MVNRFLSYLFTVLFVCGCGTTVSYLSNSESSSMTSTGLDYHDIEVAVKKSVDSLLSSRYVSDLSGVKVLAVSDIVNDTMQSVDVRELSMSVARAMRNSGRFSVTAAVSGSGGVSDDMLNKVRATRQNEEFNQYTTTEKGKLVSADLSLSGKIVQRNVRVGSKQRIDYSFLLALIDVRTGLVVWDESTHIIKVAPGGSSSW